MVSDGKKVAYGERRPRLLAIPLAGSANLHSTRFQIHQVCIGHPALNLRTFSPCSKRGRTSKCLQPASILTRRRVPFSAIEWDEFKQLALACNPYIKDSLITSRRTMVRYIAANYDFYSSEIKDSLTTASSPIHISTDLWTSPHRHSLLANVQRVILEKLKRRLLSIL
ncbi:restless transposase [Fusarium langsethiae]|uniref:Restless transposase n=1 Tax=Fusarium langsethiae TaxID=179993 RepID=A0A0M9EQK5_FUSLA|nr:restless transposase [Fusarium langsethiae]